MSLVDLTAVVGYVIATALPFHHSWRETFPVGRHNRVLWYIASWLGIWVCVFATTALIIGIITAPVLFFGSANRAP